MSIVNGNKFNLLDKMLNNAVNINLFYWYMDGLL